jgi:uncharacterized protein YjbI with pentapeptide repeats
MVAAHNFSQQNLRGQSFKGQDLAGANFSGAQIQGANFSGTQLQGASFVGAKAGSNRWMLALVVLLLVLVGLNIGFTGVTTGATVTPDQLAREGWIEAIVVFPIVMVFMVSLLGHGPSMALLATSVLVFVGWVGFLIPESFVYGGILETIWGDHPSISAEVGSVGVAIWAGLVINVFLCGGLLVIARCKGTIRNHWSYVEGLLILAVFIGALPGLIGFANGLSKLAVVVVNALLVAASMVISRRSLAEYPRFSLIRRVALAIATFGGTRFVGANLSEVDFGGARLNCADFRQAILRRTRFYGAKALDLARADGTLLRDRTVRSLLVTHQGNGRDYWRADLRDAYLAQADLSNSMLVGADLSGADLTGAWLERANLSQAIALGTQFAYSHLTGACLEGWNIDMSTGLAAVDCAYVYLLGGENQSSENQGSENRDPNGTERRPNSGEFQPGEFAKLFQEALNTVDLIFRNGLDFSAFLAAFKQVQTDHGDQQLSIRSIENKGDGMVVVKVEVPETADRAQLHVELSEGYAAELDALEARYQAAITAKDEQIEIYRRHQQDLKELTQLLSPAHARLAPSSSLGKRVVLKVNVTQPQTAGRWQNAISPIPGMPAEGRIERRAAHAVSVTLQIGAEGAIPQLEMVGSLPNYEAIRTSHARWQQAYDEIIRAIDHESRINAPAVQVTNVSYQEIFGYCRQAAQQLQADINQWLNSEFFRPIKEQLLEQLQPTDSIRFFVQTDDPLLRQLPLHVWDWFDRYPKAEVIISEPAYRQQPAASRGRGQVRILSILGDRTGIDVESDQALLEALPNVHLRLLSEPSLQQVSDQLWELPWDILFFAGHSERPRGEDAAGHLRINANDSLSLNDLKYGLRKATERGLKLAIFNTCDGLDLLRNLTDLPMPPMVVMRHPVPDQVAQVFLKNFLLAFSEGLPLHQAVREAREKLQGIEPQFPYATWLPVVCQNPASAPLIWQDLTLE